MTSLSGVPGRAVPGWFVPGLVPGADQGSGSSSSVVTSHASAFVTEVDSAHGSSVVTSHAAAFITVQDSAHDSSAVTSHAVGLVIDQGVAHGASVVTSHAAGVPIANGTASGTSAVTSHASAFVTERAAARSLSVVTSLAAAFLTHQAAARSASVVISIASGVEQIEGFAHGGSSVTGSASASLMYGIPLPPAPLPVQPAWQRDVQRFAINLERQRHVQALWQYGELTVFCLLWTAADHTAGLVGRCQRCFASTSPGLSTEDRISASYGQGNQYACTDCFGTQFEGGFRALIVRPAIFTDMDKGQTKSAKGVVTPGELGVDTTPDFRVRAGDYCFRVDGTRFQLRQPKRTTLRTGFASPWQQDAAIDYNQLRAGLEDPASVAYRIPPTASELAQLLGTYTRLPADFSWWETIRAPLIPEETPAPAASARLQPVTAFARTPANYQDVQDEAGEAVEDEAGSYFS